MTEEHPHRDTSDDESAAPDTSAGVQPVPEDHSATPRAEDNEETRLNEQFANTLKYSLASSSLLTYNLSDALPLYPALSSTPTTPSPPPTGPPSRPTTVRKPVALGWGNNWSTRVENWQDRNPFENALALVAWAVLGLFSVAATIYRTPAQPTATVPLPLVQETKPALPPAVLPSWHTHFLAKLDLLVRTAQELDLRAARALSGIKEVECIGWGLGLSVMLYLFLSTIR